MTWKVYIARYKSQDKPLLGILHQESSVADHTTLQRHPQYGEFHTNMAVSVLGVEVSIRIILGPETVSSVKEFP